MISIFHEYYYDVGIRDYTQEIHARGKIRRTYGVKAAIFVWHTTYVAVDSRGLHIVGHANFVRNTNELHGREKSPGKRRADEKKRKKRREGKIVDEDIGGGRNKAISTSKEYGDSYSVERGRRMKSKMKI